MTSTSRKKVSLPNWARISPQLKDRKKQKQKEPLSVEEEESYLRTRAYNGLSRKIDRAIDSSIRSLAAEPFQEELSALLKQLKHTNSAQEYNPSPLKRARTDISSETTSPNHTISHEEESSTVSNDWEQIFTVKASCTVQPSLLPILFLRAPTCALDRQYLIHALVRSTRRQRPRTCTVWLKEGGGRGTSWPGEVTRQCLRQEPDLPPILQNNKRFIEKSSLTETLLEWAQYTASFDDIVVFLQIDEDYYSTALQDFIHWMAERRARHGVPFILILLAPHTGRRSLNIRSSSQGPDGHLVRYHDLPSSSSVLDAFWEQLWLQEQFPLLFPNDIWNELGRAFCEQNGSAVYLASRLKMSLAHRMCQPGSFLLAANALPREERRIAWFLANSEARQLISVGNRSNWSKQALQQWITDHGLYRKRGCVYLHMLHCLRRVCGTKTLFFLFPVRTPSGLNVAIDHKDREPLLTLLLRLRRQQREADGQPGLQNTKELVDLLNELIILVDQCETFLDIDKCLNGVREDWLNWTLHNFASLTALDVQPRRQALQGLLEPSGPSTNLVSLVGNIFKLIQDQVSVLRSEWFDLYRQTFALEASRGEALLLFGYAIYHLKVCGLLRERRVPNKKDVRYEKVLLVWCSGE